IGPGGKLAATPVKDWADQHKVLVFTPANKTELAELFQTEKFVSPVGLVVDYGIIIPRSVMDSFPKGIVNSHFSLLPEWRGADPLTHAILSGQKQTGVSLMVIDEKLDEGPLLAQETYDIAANETTPTLTDRLTALSNKMIQKVLPDYVDGSLKPYSQPSSKPSTYASKLSKSD